MPSNLSARIRRRTRALAAVPVALLGMVGMAWAQPPDSLTITTTTLADATAGSAYSQTVVAAGGTTPYTFSIDAGSLPGGLSLAPGTGEISGTAHLAGTSTFTVKVTDDSSAVATRELSITVVPGAPAALAFAQQPGNIAAGASFSPDLAIGIHDADGNLVSGATDVVSLSITTGTGSLVGTTSQAAVQGVATFPGLTVQVAGTGKVITASSGSLTQAPSTAFDVSTGSAASLTFDVQPSNAAAGAAISPAARLKVEDAFGNPVASELVSLSLVGSGTLSGYAPTASDANGIATFPTLSVDVAGTGKKLSASTAALGPVLSDPFDITAGTAASLTFDVQPSNTAAGAAITPAVRLQVMDGFGNPVPTELVSLSLVGSGTLSGYAPTASDANGIATFPTLSVDVAGTGKKLSASTAALGPVLSDPFDISAGTAANLVYDVQPTNTPVNGTLAPAVRLKVTDGLGNPVPTELVSLSLVGSGTLGGYAPTATDGSGFATFPTLSVDRSGNKTLSATTTGLGPVISDPFTITCPTITLAPGTLPDGTVGTAYNQTITASGGVSPYTFAVAAGSLPEGLTLASDGSLTGTPSGAGTFNITVTATDQADCQGSHPYALVIQVSCPAISVLPASLPSGSIGVPYSQTLTASAGTAPFTFSLASGTLPAGLTLTSAGGLSGTPTSVGPSSFTVGVTDALACTGSTAYTLTILATPAAVTDLAAQQQRTGNDNDGTTRIAITFTMPPGATVAEVYRAGFGHYPRYDNAGGSVPTTPPYPPGSPWVLTPVTASGQTDEPASRDAYHYVVFVKNAGGGVSAVSNKTAGVLNYHLGDVSNGSTAGQGNNSVSVEDLSLLGANYGIAEPEITARGVDYLDVGPTIDLSPTSRPVVDAHIDFEDLIVDALNFQVVSAAARATHPAPSRAGASAEEFRVVGPSLVEVGEAVSAELWLRGGGKVQGFSAHLTWDATVVEPTGMESGQWVEGQGGVVLSPGGGVVDAALLGAREVGMTGEGRVAKVRFRVLRTGASGIGLERVTARDGANRELGEGQVVARAEEARPERTVLLTPRPNPMRGGERAELAFSLAGRGRVELAIYGVDGRRVRTVVREEREAGVYREAWDGRDDGGRTVGSGVYYAHLVAGGARFTQMLLRIR